MKSKLIIIFFLIFSISRSAQGITYQEVQKLIEFPPIAFVLFSLIVIIFVCGLLYFMFSTILSVGLIGLIFISIFFSEDKKKYIKKFLKKHIGIPPIKKFLFARMTKDEFKEHSIGLIFLTVCFFFGFIGLDLWINLFNYKSSFILNQGQIFYEHLFRDVGINKGFNDNSIIGFQSIYLIFYSIIPYYLIGSINYVWKKVENKNEKEQKQKNKFNSSMFSEFFSSVRSQESKNKNDIESRLDKLKKLLDENVITKEEYEEQRKKIIRDV